MLHEDFSVVGGTVWYAARHDGRGLDGVEMGRRRSGSHWEHVGGERQDYGGKDCGGKDCGGRSYDGGCRSDLASHSAHSLEARIPNGGHEMVCGGGRVCERAGRWVVAHDEEWLVGVAFWGQVSK